MHSTSPWFVAFVAVGLTAVGCGSAHADDRPANFLVVLADDLGYGDLSCYNPESKVSTPRIDALAAEGMRFLDAHSASTVCTPTRYSFLTGRMCFRTGYRGVFAGAGGPCLIDEERLTLGAMLQGAGYRTALIGKWHIGLTFFDSAGARVTQGGLEGVRRIDWSRPIPDAPIHRGFDEFFGTACCPTTDWLYAYIEGDRIPVPPVEQFDRSTLPQNPYTCDCRAGMIAPNFELDRVDLVFLERSRAFLREHVAKRPDQPFFLLHSMQAVHLPSLPAPAFQGKSGIGAHGDFLVEMDWIVGELLDTLAELEIADDTVVMFVSDNGPEVPTVNAMRRDHGHDGARPWRGVKRDQWEGGHRTPMLVRWPERVAAGTTANEPVSLTDVFATFASIVGRVLPNDAAEDSFDLLPILLQDPREGPLRPYLLQQTWTNQLSIRRGEWKYLDHRGSGGNNYAKEGPWGMARYALADTDPDAPGQLYHLGEDPGETINLYSQHPEIVAELKALLDESVNTGRSAPRR